MWNKEKNFYVLHMKHDVIMQTEHATYNLTFANDFRRQANPTE